MHWHCFIKTTILGLLFDILMLVNNPKFHNALTISLSTSGKGLWENQELDDSKDGRTCTSASAPPEQSYYDAQCN